MFHVCGPAKAKACLPNFDRGFGTTRLPAGEERRRCLAATAVTAEDAPDRCLEVQQKCSCSSRFSTAPCY